MTSAIFVMCVLLQGPDLPRGRAFPISSINYELIPRVMEPIRRLAPEDASDQVKAIARIEYRYGTVEKLTTRSGESYYQISLSNQSLTDSDIRDLSQIENLTRLNLSNAKLTDAAVQELPRLKDLKSLEPVLKRVC